jgi:hypothetical protein
VEQEVEHLDNSFKLSNMEWNMEWHLNNSLKFTQQRVQQSTVNNSMEGDKEWNILSTVLKLSNKIIYLNCYIYI